MKKTVYVIVFVLTVFLLAGCRNGRPANSVFTPADAQGREIGVLYGSSSSRYAAGLGNARLYYNSSEMMDALKSGLLDCVVVEKEPAERIRASGVKTLSEPLLECDFRFAIAKENADLTKDVNSAIAILSENGTLKALKDKHVLGKSYTYVTPESAGSRSGTLTLVIPGDFPPYAYKNETGEYVGFDVDTARAVCDILGVGMEIIEADANKLITTVRFGKADFALGGLYETEADKELIDFSDAYTHFTQVVIVRR